MDAHKITIEDLMNGFLSSFMMCAATPEFVEDLNFLLKIKTPGGLSAREVMQRSGHGSGLDAFMSSLQMTNAICGEKMYEILETMPSFMHDVTEQMATSTDKEQTKAVYHDLMSKLMGENFKVHEAADDVVKPASSNETQRNEPELDDVAIATIKKAYDCIKEFVEGSEFKRADTLDYLIRGMQGFIDDPANAINDDASESDLEHIRLNMTFNGLAATLKSNVFYEEHYEQDGSDFGDFTVRHCLAGGLVAHMLSAEDDACHLDSIDSIVIDVLGGLCDAVKDVYPMERIRDMLVCVENSTKLFGMKK